MSKDLGLYTYERNLSKLDSMHYFVNKRMDFTRLAKIHCLDVDKSTSNFDELGFIFKVKPALRIVQIRISVRYFLNH